MTTAPCSGLWWLFDSTDIRDHAQARAICDTCPVIAECAEIAAKLRKGSGFRLEGTWAGRLHGRPGRPRKLSTIAVENGLGSTHTVEQNFDMENA